MAAVDSVRLHGKIWMAENDTRTFLTRPLREVAPGICPEGQYEGGLWAGPDSLETSATLMRNNLARMLTHGYGGWWFDMWGGWYSHPVLLAEIRAAQQLWFERLEPSDPKRIPSDSVCVVMDERVSDLLLRHRRPGINHDIGFIPRENVDSVAVAAHHAGRRGHIVGDDPVAALAFQF